MEFEDLTVVKGGKQKSSPIFDSIMNGMQNWSDFAGPKLVGAVDYVGDVVDGAGIRLGRAIDDPVGTVKDIGLGALNSLPSTVSAIGDFTGYETPTSDNATKFLRSKLADSDSLGFDLAEVVGTGGIVSAGAKGTIKAGGAIEQAALKQLHKIDPHTANTITALNRSTLANKGTDIPSNYIEQRGRNWYSALKSKATGKPGEVRSEYISGMGGNSTSKYTPAGTNFNYYDQSLYADKTAERVINKSGEVVNQHAGNIGRYFDKYTRKHEGDHQLWKNTKYAPYFNEQIPNAIPLQGVAKADPKYYGSAGEINARSKELLLGIDLAKKRKLTKKESDYLNDLYNNEVKPFIDNMGKDPKFRGSEAQKLRDTIKSVAGNKAFQSTHADMFSGNANKFREAGSELIEAFKQNGRDSLKAAGGIVATNLYVNRERN